MKVGAERNKIVILGGLTLVAGYVFYSNVLSGPDVPSGRPSVAAPSGPPAISATSSRRATERRSAGTPRIQEFKPSLVPKKGEEPDLASIDPTLRLDLLRRVQAVEKEGGERNLFQFSAAPPPPAPKVAAPKIVPKTPQQVAQEQAQQAQALAASPPTPINLKFYGYLNHRSEGGKRAFLLDGEDIIVAEEGDVVKKRYKIVRIGVNSVVVEDTQSANTQTLPLQMPVQQGT
jgi:hypothetical protein